MTFSSLLVQHMSGHDRKIRSSEVVILKIEFCIPEGSHSAVQLSSFVAMYGIS